MSTTQKQAEEQARETEILRASEREQRRISQDLHDGLGQQLAGISCLTAGLGEDLVTVSDNGAGLKKSADRRQGLGLRIMQHRASVMGGTFGLKENRHGGVDVICTVEKPDAPKPEPRG